MELWLAILSGVIGGSTLLLGAVLAWFVAIPKLIVAGIMAAGAGVLISTLAFELVEEAAEDGGLVPTIVGFVGGAVLYIVADWLVSRPPRPRAKIPANVVRRRAGAKLAGGSGVTIAIGALIDGIPESIVMGLSVIGGGISVPIVAAIAISNIPEGLASTAALKESGASGWQVARLWLSIAAVTVVASASGYLLFQSAGADVIALITTIAAGGLLAMVCNTMIPEAFERQHALTGLWATLGFLAAFVLHEIG